LLSELFGKEDEVVAEQKVFDSHGEELMAHTSKNTMNDMILNNNATHTVGDKRSRGEAG